MRFKLHSPASWFVAASLVFHCGSASAFNLHRSLVTRVAPLYPEIARRMHLEGSVTLHIVIQPDGTVSDTRIESGNALLAAAAQDAVRRWRYSPSNEVSELNVAIDFTINGH